MPTPATQQEKPAPTRKTVRNLLRTSHPAKEGPQRVHSNADLIELAAIAMGRGLSLATTSQTLRRMPDSDTFHHHLHGKTAHQVYEQGRTCLRDLLAIPTTLGWLDDPVDVAVDQHKEPYYGQEHPWVVSGKRQAGTNKFHTYFTSQRVTDPRLTLDVQLLTPLRNRHEALAALVETTQAIQPVRTWLLDKEFCNQYDLGLLLDDGHDFVVAAPRSKALDRIQRGLRRTAVRRDLGRSVATTRHRFGGPKAPEVTLVFVWEPDQKQPAGETWHAYAVARDAPIQQLERWVEAYRTRWGIETGYRSLEDLRLRTTTTHYSNRLYLTLLAILLDIAWRLLRHARSLRRPDDAPLTLPRFMLALTEHVDWDVAA